MRELPRTVADAGTDGEGSPQRLDWTSTHGHTRINVAAFVIVDMRCNEACRPEAAAFQPLPQARSVPAYGPVALGRGTDRARAQSPVRPRRRVTRPYSGIPPAATSLATERARGHHAVAPAAWVAFETPGPADPDVGVAPGRVRNVVPDALGSPDKAPARPPAERHAGSDVRVVSQRRTSSA